MMPVADTSWVMSRLAAFSVCTVMPGTFLPQKAVLSMINRMMLPIAIQMIFLRDFFLPFFPLAMWLVLLAFCCLLASFSGVSSGDRFRSRLRTPLYAAARICSKKIKTIPHARSRN